MMQCSRKLAYIGTELCIQYDFVGNSLALPLQQHVSGTDHMWVRPTCLLQCTAYTANITVHQQQESLDQADASKLRSDPQFAKRSSRFRLTRNELHSQARIKNTQHGHDGSADCTVMSLACCCRVSLMKITKVQVRCVVSSLNPRCSASFVK